MRNIIVHTEKYGRDSWRAVICGYEPGDPVGYGSTEADAVYELFMELEDREQADEQERYNYEMGDAR